RGIATQSSVRLHDSFTQMPSTGRDMYNKSVVIRRLAGPLLLAGVLSVGSGTPAHALVINATYAPGPNGEVIDDASKAVIKNAIGFYESTFRDNVTVDIQFHYDPNCYGCSDTTRYNFSLSDVSKALIADKKSADDATATANLPASLLYGDTIA